MVNKLLAAALAAVLLLSSGLLASASDGAQAGITLDGVSLAASAKLEGGSVYLPVRAVGQALGYSVTWSDQKESGQIVTLTGKTNTVSLYVTTQRITRNGHTYYMDAGARDACILSGGTTYLDSAFFAENFAVRVRYDAQSGIVKLTRATENAVELTTMRLNTEDESLTVSLRYPQIGGSGDIEAQNEINDVLRHAATSALDTGLKSSFELLQVKKDYPDMPYTCAADLNYRLTYNQNGLFCVTLDEYQYAGGAHGSTLRSSYAFDLATGKALTLMDLFRSDEDYLAYLNAAIRREIDRRVASGELYEFEDGKFETIGEQPDFYLTDGALVLYFQQYAYFPYAAGIQEFRVPFAELKSMLRDEYAFLAE